MRRTVVLGLAILGLASLGLSACGDETTKVSSGGPARDADQRYRVAAGTVLESPDHGPQLCFSVADSYPPQCSGIDLTGWDWDTVDGAESASGTTWVSASLTGTYDGESFAVDEIGPASPVAGDDHDFSPLCDDYDREATVTPPDASFDDIAGVAAVFVSDPSGDWDGPFVVNIIATPGNGDDVRAAAEERWDGALCVVERDQPTRAELAEVANEIGAVDGAPWGQVFGWGADELRGVVLVHVTLADEVSQAWAAERWGDLVLLEGALEPID